jgi:periplasmic divalent cation tolerance protein
MDAEIDVVLTTVPDETVARELVETLVRERHAACGNIIPGIASIYWWHGAVQHGDEVVIFLKTARAQTAALLERARRIHPYDVPELIVLPVRTGNPSYLDWVVREASGRGTG